MNNSSLVIDGIGASPGISIGKAHVLDRHRIAFPKYNVLGDEAVELECRRFEEAVVKAESDLESIKKTVRSEFMEHAHLLEVQQMILRDRSIYDESLNFIRRDRLNAQLALLKSLAKARQVFSSLNDDYVRSRIADVEAAAERVMRILSGQEQSPLDEIRDRVIVVAHEISPADAIQLEVEHTLGVITEIGGRTSHTSIIARSLNIPAVVAAENATRLITTGEILIIDGTTGKIIINPTEDEIGFYYERQLELENYIKEIGRKAHLSAQTRDGYTISVEANIEMLEEVGGARENGAEAIGLYRTEFFFMNRADMPDEESLFRDYRDLSELMAPSVVTIRTLDLGAEKLSAWYPKLDEVNPVLGLRSIRLCLHYPELFKVQLRAILRASAAAKNIRVMFPLVSGVAELLDAKRIVNGVKEDLERERIPFDENIQIGVMIELPSAVAVADLLATEVDFFSIGTNDLIQYSIGIDRTNEHVAYLFEPLHPAVLRFIKHTVDAGHKAGISVALCGEMAGEPLYLPILLGFGIDSLSMNPQSLPRVKNLIRRSLIKDCRRLAKKALRLSTAREINELLEKTIKKSFPEEFRVFNPSAFAVKGPARSAHRIPQTGTE